MTKRSRADARAAIKEIAGLRQIALVTSNGGVIHESPWVEQRSSYKWLNLGVGDLDMGGIAHMFELVLKYFDLERRPTESDADLSRYFRETMAPFVIPTAPEILTDGRLLLGRLTVDEFPVHLLERTTDWYTMLDGIGEEGDVLSRLIKAQRRIALAEGLLTLIDGSFLWPRTLEIHPLIRGQRVGVRLLAHAMDVLHRSVGDLAGFAVGTIDSLYGDRRVKLTRAGAQRLRRYYAEAGFLPWRGDRLTVYRTFE